MRSVTKEEFDAFLLGYGKRLDRDVYQVSDPPVVTWNDFTLGVWPESIVASARLQRDGSLPLEGFRIKVDK